MTKEAKRIIFSNECPNDQGGIIPNDTLDFSRYMMNPVVLAGHDWDSLPLALMSDIRFDGVNWTGIPEFHEIDDKSRLYKKYFETGNLKACSIGGECIWKTTGKRDMNGRPEFYRNEQGLKVAEKFFLYEISLVTLPSNPEAVSLSHALIYNTEELNQVADKVAENIVTLKTQLQTKKAEQMTEEEKTALAAKTAEEKEKADAENKAAEQAEADAKAQAEKEAADLAAKEALKKQDNSKHVILESGLPKVIADLLTSIGKIIGIKTEEAVLPIHDEPGGGDPVYTDPSKKADASQEVPTGLKSKLEKVEITKKELEEAKEKFEIAKKAYEEDENEENEKSYKSAEAECNQAIDKAEKAKAEYEAEEEASKVKAKAEADEAELKAKEEADAKAKKGAEEKAEAEKVKQEAEAKLTALKTEKELITDGIKLAPKPEKIIKMNTVNKTFTQLRTDLKNGNENSNEAKAFGRILNKETHSVEAGDYAMLAASMLKDERIKPIIEKIRFISNITASQYEGRRENNTAHRAGTSFQALAENLTKLSSTDDALTTPDIYAIEWLTLFIFKLFPDNSWKSEIPVFGVSETSRNTGVIWANIGADPDVHIGTKPTTPAAYATNDTAVSLKLTPYYLNPMLFEPLKMAQLRYDQMGSNWAQAFMKLEATVDDMLLYTLASTVPAASRVSTTGTPFNIASSSDVNAFYWGTFTGNLAKPILNDLIRLEQIYRKQNFELSKEKSVLVLDSTAEAFLAQDSEVKNKLTEWKNIGDGSFMSFRNTIMHSRSRVAVYDPATSVVKDPYGVIPSTATSSCVSFIPSQVGIGLGNIDIFMLQDPTNYGYLMSADIRKGIAPLRKNYNGTALLNYGDSDI